MSSTLNSTFSTSLISWINFIFKKIIVVLEIEWSEKLEINSLKPSKKPQSFTYDWTLIITFFIFSVKTTAKRVGDDLIINGSKMWITNAFQADWICLLANDTACAGKPIHMNKSLICVPMDTEG